MRTEILMLSLLAVASAECAPDDNASLAAMRGRWRPLLVFASSLHDPGFLQQMKELRAHALDVTERDILVVPVISSQPVSVDLFPDLPVAILTEREVADAMRRFHVSAGSFYVVVVGKDGGAKLTSKAAVTIQDLNRLIDSMPMRRQEMRESGKSGG